jgi:hypothetical protein
MAHHHDRFSDADKSEGYPDDIRGGMSEGNALPAYPEGNVDQEGDVYDPYGEKPKLGMFRVRSHSTRYFEAEEKFAC